MPRTYTRTFTLAGNDAINYAAANGMTLSTHTDPTQEGRDGVSVDEAREIAAVDPRLVHLSVPVRLTRAAIEVLEETGCDVQVTLDSLLDGVYTPATLLEHCLDGADDDREEGWRDVVDALESILDDAQPRGVVTIRAAVEVDAIIAAGEDARIEVWDGCSTRVRAVLAENAERVNGDRYELRAEDGGRYTIEIVRVFGGSNG